MLTNQYAPYWKPLPPGPWMSPAAPTSARDGAGHYVKMVHNGIEYADMQLIAESLSSVEIMWADSTIRSWLISLNPERRGSFTAT